MTRRFKKTSPSKRGRKAGWTLGLIAVLVVGAVTLPTWLARRSGTQSLPASATPTNTLPVRGELAKTGATQTLPLGNTNAPAASNALPVMEVNKALMVTVELDFGTNVPTVAEALREIERRHTPADGLGRVFAILDAYGERMPQGRLHMSMHLSMEKPGLGELVFKRTGESLWKSQVVAGTNAGAFTGKNLTIYMDDGAGKSVTVDGSMNPRTILDAGIKEAGVPVSVFWPDAAEREFTFLYSACGCPVKVLAKRNGNTTLRTKDLPVIFPDDPAAVAVINRLMGW
jgi:hypothetical protein